MTAKMGKRCRLAILVATALMISICSAATCGLPAYTFSGPDSLMNCNLPTWSPSITLTGPSATVTVANVQAARLTFAVTGSADGAAINIDGSQLQSLVAAFSRGGSLAVSRTTIRPTAQVTSAVTLAGAAAVVSFTDTTVESAVSSIVPLLDYRIRDGSSAADAPSLTLTGGTWTLDHDGSTPSSVLSIRPLTTERGADLAGTLSITVAGTRIVIEDSGASALPDATAVVMNISDASGTGADAEVRVVVTDVTALLNVKRNAALFVTDVTDSNPKPLPVDIAVHGLTMQANTTTSSGGPTQTVQLFSLVPGPTTVLVRDSLIDIHGNPRLLSLQGGNQRNDVNVTFVETNVMANEIDGEVMLFKVDNPKNSEVGVYFFGGSLHVLNAPKSVVGYAFFVDDIDGSFAFEASGAELRLEQATSAASNSIMTLAYNSRNALPDLSVALVNGCNYTFVAETNFAMVWVHTSLTETIGQLRIELADSVGYLASKGTAWFYSLFTPEMSDLRFNSPTILIAGGSLQLNIIGGFSFFSVTSAKSLNGMHTAISDFNLTGFAGGAFGEQLFTIRGIPDVFDMTLAFRRVAVDLDLSPDAVQASVTRFTHGHFQNVTIAVQECTFNLTSTVIRFSDANVTSSSVMITGTVATLTGTFERSVPIALLETWLRLQLVDFVVDLSNSTIAVDASNSSGSPLIVAAVIGNAQQLRFTASNCATVVPMTVGSAALLMTQGIIIDSSVTVTGANVIGADPNILLIANLRNVSATLRDSSSSGTTAGYSPSAIAQAYSSSALESCDFAIENVTVLVPSGGGPVVLYLVGIATDLVLKVSDCRVVGGVSAAIVFAHFNSELTGTRVTASRCVSELVNETRTESTLKTLSILGAFRGDSSITVSGCALTSVSASQELVQASLVDLGKAANNCTLLATDSFVNVLRGDEVSGVVSIGSLTDSHVEVSNITFIVTSASQLNIAWVQNALRSSLQATGCTVRGDDIASMAAIRAYENIRASSAITTDTDVNVTSCNKIDAIFVGDAVEGSLVEVRNVSIRAQASVLSVVALRLAGILTNSNASIHSSTIVVGTAFELNLLEGLQDSGVDHPSSFFTASDVLVQGSVASSTQSLVKTGLAQISVLNIHCEIESSSFGTVVDLYGGDSSMANLTNVTYIQRGGSGTIVNVQNHSATVTIESSKFTVGKRPNAPSTAWCVVRLDSISEGQMVSLQLSRSALDVTTESFALGIFTGSTKLASAFNATVVDTSMNVSATQLAMGLALASAIGLGEAFHVTFVGVTANLSASEGSWFAQSLVAKTTSISISRSSLFMSGRTAGIIRNTTSSGDHVSVSIERGSTIVVETWGSDPLALVTSNPTVTTTLNVVDSWITVNNSASMAGGLLNVAVGKTNELVTAWGGVNVINSSIALRETTSLFRFADFSRPGVVNFTQTVVVTDSLSSVIGLESPSGTATTMSFQNTSISQGSTRGTLTFMKFDMGGPAAFPTYFSCVFLDGTRLKESKFGLVRGAARPLLTVDQEDLLCPTPRTATASHSRSSSVTGSPTKTAAGSQSASISPTVTRTATISPNVTRTATISLVAPVPNCGNATVWLTLDPRLSDEVSPSTFRGPPPSMPTLELTVLQSAAVTIIVQVDHPIAFASSLAEHVKLRCVDGEGLNDNCNDKIAQSIAATPLDVKVLADGATMQLGPWPDFVSVGNQNIAVVLDERAFACRRMPLDQRRPTFKVVAPILSQLRAAAATADAVAVVAAVTAAANPAGTLDAQTLAVFSMISCSSAKGRYAAGSTKLLLSPMSIGPEPEGFIVFNFIIVSAVLGSFLLAMGFRVCVKHDTIDHAMHVARFPSLFFKIAMLLYQGCTILSMRLIFDGVFSASAFFGVVYTVVLPLGIWKTCVTRAVDALFLVPGRLQFVLYDETLRFGNPYDPSWLKWLRWAFVPQGRWDPGTLRRRFAGPLGSVLPTWRMYAVVPLAQAFLVCFVASVPFGGRSGCIGQYAALFCLFSCFGIGIFYCSPLRSRGENWLQGAIYIVLSSVVACTGLMSVYPDDHPVTEALLPVFMGLQAVLMIIKLIAGICVAVAERFWWKKRLTKQLWSCTVEDLRDGPLIELQTFGGPSKKSNAGIPVTDDTQLSALLVNSHEECMPGSPGSDMRSVLGSLHSSAAAGESLQLSPRNMPQSPRSLGSAGPNTASNDRVRRGLSPSSGGRSPRLVSPQLHL